MNPQCFRGAHCSPVSSMFPSMDSLLTNPLQFAVCELLQGVQTHKFFLIWLINKRIGDLVKTRIEYPVGGGSPRVVMYDDPNDGVIRNLESRLHQTQNELDYLHYANQELQGQISYQQDELIHARSEVDDLRYKVETMEYEKLLDSYGEKIEEAISSDGIENLLNHISWNGGSVGELNSLLAPSIAPSYPVTSIKYENAVKNLSDRYSNHFNNRNLLQDFILFNNLVLKSHVFYRKELYHYDMEKNLVSPSDLEIQKQKIDSSIRDYNQFKDEKIRNASQELSSIQFSSRNSYSDGIPILPLFVLIGLDLFANLSIFPSHDIAVVIGIYAYFEFHGEYPIQSRLGILAYFVFYLYWYFFLASLDISIFFFASITFSILLVAWTFFVKFEYINPERKITLAEEIVQKNESSTLSSMKSTIDLNSMVLQSMIYLHNYAAEFVRYGKDNFQNLEIYFAQIGSDAYEQSMTQWHKIALEFLSTYRTYPEPLIYDVDLIMIPEYTKIPEIDLIGMIVGSGHIKPSSEMGV